MLRRKFMLFLGSLLIMLVLASIVSIYLLQGVLGEMDHAATQDGAILQTANTMTDSITDIEIELREVQLGNARHLDRLLDLVGTLKDQTDQFGREYERPIPQARDRYLAIVSALDVFQHHVAMLATVEDESLSRAHTAEAIGASITLRQEILCVARIMRQHTTAEEHAAIDHFRWIVLGIAIGFLVLINTSLLVLYRMATMVTAPVEKLVEASRRLAHEEFTFRVHLPGRHQDEFNELAAAYNQLAERLQASERRKLETLMQTAIMLNHELNNASAIIQLQIQLLRRQSTGNDAFERGLRQINESLERMTRTVESLKRVRRIVLTTYTAGTQMLDLEKSTMEFTENEDAPDARKAV